MPVGGKYFSSVRKAREALKERAHEILDGYIATIRQAAAAGDYETAVKGYQHLLDHMPDEEGTRVVDVSVDKKVDPASQAQIGPTINIGVAIGGMKKEPLTIEAPKIEIDDTQS